MRAAFEAHEIPFVINAEQHASLFGGLGGALVPLHVFVDDEHAEEAAALWKDLVKHPGEPDDPESAAEAAEGAEEEEEEEEEQAASELDPIEVRTTRRRRTVVVLLLGCCVTFGTAHLFTGAWFRAIALAGLEMLALAYLFGGEVGRGAFLLLAGIATDVLGGLWRVYMIDPVLPAARTHR